MEIAMAQPALRQEPRWRAVVGRGDRACEVGRDDDSDGGPSTASATTLGLDAVAAPVRSVAVGTATARPSVASVAMMVVRSAE